MHSSAVRRDPTLTLIYGAQRRHSAAQATIITIVVCLAGKALLIAKIIVYASESLRALEFGA